MYEFSSAFCTACSQPLLFVLQSLGHRGQTHAGAGFQPLRRNLHRQRQMVEQIANLLGGPAALARCRKPTIMADAAHAILIQDSRACTGHFFVDESLLRMQGIDDFSRYAVEPGRDLMPDFFL